MRVRNQIFLKMSQYLNVHIPLHKQSVNMPECVSEQDVLVLVTLLVFEITFTQLDLGKLSNMVDLLFWSNWCTISRQKGVSQQLRVHSTYKGLSRFMLRIYLFPSFMCPPKAMYEWVCAPECQYAFVSVCLHVCACTHVFMCRFVTANQTAIAFNELYILIGKV